MDIAFAATVCACVATLVTGLQSGDVVAVTAREGAFLRVGHDNVVVDPALRRYTGIVTEVGAPDAEGRVYSFRAVPIGPRSAQPAADALRGWRLTILAGKRFASVFEVKANTEIDIVVVPRDGALNGLAVNDVFIVEEVAN